VSVVNKNTHPFQPSVSVNNWEGMGDQGIITEERELKGSSLSGTLLNVHGINLTIGAKGQEFELAETLQDTTTDPGG